MKRCVNAGCSRVCAGRHNTCCSICGMVSTRMIESGSSPHTSRCQKVQRHFWQAQETVPASALEECWTAGCGRMTTPGFDSCCSRCKLSGGRVHSKRCHYMQPTTLRQYNASASTGNFRPSPTAWNEKGGSSSYACNEWTNTPARNGSTRLSDQELAYGYGAECDAADGTAEAVADAATPFVTSARKTQLTESGGAVSEQSPQVKIDLFEMD